MASIINSQPVFVFRHGFRQDHMHPVDPPIHPINQPSNGEQELRLIELNKIIDFVVNLKKPVIIAHSPFLRCRETAAFAVNQLMIKGVRHMNIQIDYDFTELGHAAYSACVKNNLNTFLPYPIEAISNETHIDAYKRFNNAFDKYINIAKENDCAVLIFSHGDAIASEIQKQFKNTVFSVPSLSWFATYADNPEKITWCEDIGMIDGTMPYNWDAFVG